MSFLNELVQKKKNLKSSHSVITSLSGNKYIEKKNDLGVIEIKTLPETCQGFVVDEKPDLQIVDVLEYLYLSAQDVAQDSDLLKKNKISHVLSVGVDSPNPGAVCNIQFKEIELYDEPTADITDILNSCIEFIENVRKESEKNKVLVHCNAGYSRGPTIVIAYLMKKFRYSFDESFNIIKQKRNVKPNPGFIKQLKKFEKSL